MKFLRTPFLRNISRRLLLVLGENKSSNPDQFQKFTLMKLENSLKSSIFSKKLFYRTLENGYFLVQIIGLVRNTATSKIESFAERDNKFCYCCKTLRLRCLRGLLAICWPCDISWLWYLHKRLRKEKHSFDFDMIGSINRVSYEIPKLQSVYNLEKFELIRICNE